MRAYAGYCPEIASFWTRENVGLLRRLSPALQAASLIDMLRYFSSSLKNVLAAGLVSFFTHISSEIIVPALPIFLTAVLGATARKVELRNCVGFCRCSVGGGGSEATGA